MRPIDLLPCESVVCATKTHLEGVPQTRPFWAFLQWTKILWTPPLSKDISQALWQRRFYLEDLVNVIFFSQKKFDTPEYRHFFILLYGSCVCHPSDSEEEELPSVECHMYHAMLCLSCWTFSDSVWLIIARLWVKHLEFCIHNFISCCLMLTSVFLLK